MAPGKITEDLGRENRFCNEVCLYRDWTQRAQAGKEEVAIQMHYRTLGKTGLQVSQLGLGGIPIQKAERKNVRRLLERMIASGVNYMDSARGYTVSEAYLGEAMKGLREKFIIATKSMARTRTALEKDILTSLQNFQTDYIDLYQCHNPKVEELDAFCGEDGGLEALKAAQAQGKIGHLGVTAHSREVFEKALTLDWVETIMFPYNIVETQGEDLIAACQQKNIGFIAMKPLAGGAIDDPNLAIRYILQNPGVSVAIPGMHCVEELEQNVAAAIQQVPFSQEEEMRIQEIRRTLSGNFCRRCNYCAPCSVGIDIPGVFVLKAYFERYGLAQWAIDRYEGMAKHAGDCIDCGQCESRCPYQLPIRQMMKTTVEEFGK